MTAAGERKVLFIDLAAGAAMPLIDDQLTVHIDPNAIISLSVEAIDACLQVHLPAPAHGEVIGRQAASWRITTPVEVDLVIIAGQSRAAFQLAVGPIFALPIRIGRGTDSLPPDFDFSIAAMLVVVDAYGMVTR